MTTTTHRLMPLPVHPPGRNGRSDDPPPSAPQPRRPARDPWDVRRVRQIWWWLRLPVRIVIAVLWDMPTTYPQVRGFVVAHAKGFVPRETRTARLESCGDCPYRVVVAGKAYCGRCACGTHPAAKLTWKTRLKAGTCPDGRWESDNGI